MAEKKTPTCPICHRPVALRPENQFFPFCSNRCQVVDLSKWLNEEYRVPTRETDEGDGSGEDEGAERLH